MAAAPQPRGPLDTFDADDLRPTSAWREGLSAGAVEDQAESPRAPPQGPDAHPPGSAVKAERICCMDRGHSPGMGRDGRERPGVALRGRAFPQVAQGEGAEIPRGGARVPRPGAELKRPLGLAATER